jgi:N4-gp56 family major capsid protein
MTTLTNLPTREQIYADKKLLVRAQPNNILGQFGQVRPIPKNKTDTIVFRRYEKLANATTPIVEGVTPTGKDMTYTDVQGTLKQYGDFVTITDHIKDMHTDPVANETLDVLGEQAAETYDVLRFGVLRAGTNVQYANGTSRSAVNTVVTVALFRTANRILRRQEARMLKRVINASVKIDTHPIREAFVVCHHVDVQPDLEALTGWIPSANYSEDMGHINGEIGSLLNFRFVIDNNMTPWADAGGAKGNTLSTTGVNSDVYPMLIFGKDAYGLVGLGGKGSVQTLVSNPRPQGSDPLAQRGTMGWKGYMTTVILNDLFMLRLEVAANG